MQHIIESHTTRCVICGERKGGRFTVFYVDKDGDEYCFDVCRDCLGI